MKARQFYYTTGVVKYSRVKGSSRVRAIITQLQTAQYEDK